MGDENDNNSKRFFCKVSSCVYKIECGICGIEYIGQTGNELHNRINGHRAEIKKGTLENTEIIHFQSHDFQKAKVCIIEIVNNLGERKVREDIHMMKYRTLYPFGLNDFFCNTN